MKPAAEVARVALRAMVGVPVGDDTRLNGLTAGAIVRYATVLIEQERAAAWREARKSAFIEFNDAMNEFVDNMKVDAPSARETMRRRMMSAINGETPPPERAEKETT
jgi:hypothetical protein